MHAAKITCLGNLGCVVIIYVDDKLTAPTMMMIKLVVVDDDDGITMRSSRCKSDLASTVMGHFSKKLLI